MADAREGPRITLVTPREVELSEFPDRLAACLDRVPVACLRLSLATRDEDRTARVADALREVAHGRDVPLVVEGHEGLVQRLGLDGVHLADGARQVRAWRRELGADAIVGAFCGASRHDGMTAGEWGADYVSFDARAEPDLFAWWSEMIELPVIAEGGLDGARVRELAPVVDFFAVGTEIWASDDPAGALAALVRAMD